MTPEIQIGDNVNYVHLWQQVFHERTRQDKLWGEQNHSPDRWMTILTEEVGEAAHAINENDLDNYRREMIQVAAVALAAVECLDRGKWNDKVAR